MNQSIHIRVNGEPRGFQSGGTVGDLLRELAITTERVAVELNLEILDRAEFDRRGLQDGDRVEILGFIGGGTGIADAASLI
ncbi:Thiazole synthase (fragment) [Nitrospira japonica]|uniref:Thiazole synthase n=1 Tax=Nitrospira japonica TaxID=1325564 RepID=A0A1W1HZR9_9BACT